MLNDKEMFQATGNGFTTPEAVGTGVGAAVGGGGGGLIAAAGVSILATFATPVASIGVLEAIALSSASTLAVAGGVVVGACALGAGIGYLMGGLFD